jgi:hypothetical protein
MSHTLSPAFSRIATIDSVYRPLERYLERFDPTPDGPGLLSPLDAYLLHLVVEFCPRPAFVADLACHATAGTSSVVCLSNPGVSRVGLAAPCAAPGPRGAGLGDLLGDFLADEGDPARRQAVLALDRAEPPWAPIRAALAHHEQPLFLLDATEPDRDGIPQVAAILEEFPRALALVIGVGRAGECEAARRLVVACHERSPYRLRLLREAAAPLLESRLALVARRDCRFAAPLVRRIEQLFTTNYDFLNMLRDSCMYAVDRGIVERLDREIEELRSRIEPPCTHPVEREIIERQNREIEGLRGCIEPLLGEIDRRDRQIEGLRLQIDRECARPILKALVLQCGRRALSFGRRHRALLAPRDSRREKMVKSVMRFQRRLRGRAA